MTTTNRLLQGLLNSTSRLALAPEADAGGGGEAPAAGGAEAPAGGAADAGGGDAPDPLAALTGDKSLLGDALAEGEKKPDAEAGKEGEAGKETKAEGAEGEKTAEQKADEAAKAEADKDVGDGDFDIKPPENFAALDTDALKAATPILKELGVTTNARAQEVVNRMATEVLAPMLQRAAAAQTSDLVKTILTQRQEWADAVEKDPELGGAKLAENMAHAARARDAFGTPALKAYLNETGAGNHPELVRAFVAIGKAMGEDSFHREDAAAQGGKTREEKFYSAEFQPKS